MAKPEMRALSSTPAMGKLNVDKWQRLKLDLFKRDSFETDVLNFDV
jgi:hypothetical protein